MANTIEKNKHNASHYTKWVNNREGFTKRGWT